MTDSGFLSTRNGAATEFFTMLGDSRERRARLFLELAHAITIYARGPLAAAQSASTLAASFAFNEMLHVLLEHVLKTAEGARGYSDVDVLEIVEERASRAGVEDDLSAALQSVVSRERDRSSRE